MAAEGDHRICCLHELLRKVRAHVCVASMSSPGVCAQRLGTSSQPDTSESSSRGSSELFR
eukprot:5052892-Amphidinium_carterae.2